MSRTIRRKNAVTNLECPSKTHWKYVHLWMRYPDSPELVKEYEAKYDAETAKLLREFRTDNGWRTGIYSKPVKEETRLRGARSYIRQECHRVLVEGDYEGFEPDHYNTIRKYSRWCGW